MRHLWKAQFKDIHCKRWRSTWVRAARDVEGAGLAEFSSEQRMIGSVWIKERRGLLQILFCKPNEYRRNW